MENEQLTNGQQVYPNPTNPQMSGPIPETPTISVAAVRSIDEAAYKPVNKWSIALLILMLFTFFTPIGAVLFLPMIVIGTIAATDFFRNTSSKSDNQQLAKNPVVQAVKVLLIIGAVLAIFANCWVICRRHAMINALENLNQR